MNIKILDYTLRDGGYINNWNFKDRHISKILEALDNSRVDIIECGYLNKQGLSENSTLFADINNLDKFISPLKNKSIKVLMINFGDFDVTDLKPKHKSLIDGIRLAFHKENLNEALKQAKIIKDKGYKVFFQPMITKRFSDIEFLNMLNLVNTLRPYAFYIVDSFGSIKLSELNKFMLLSNDNLNAEISIGYHSHNNMQLAFSNAIAMCQYNAKRDIILDSSVYGMGRGAGNLNTELVCDFLNKEFETNYNILPLLELIDSLLDRLKSKNSWGFSIAQYLSASLEIHPNYATFLTQRNTNYIATIFKILQQIPNDKRKSFDKAILEKIYIQTITQTNAKPQGKINFSKKDTSFGSR